MKTTFKHHENLFRFNLHGKDGASRPSQIPELSSAVFAKNLSSQKHLIQIIRKTSEEHLNI